MTATAASPLLRRAFFPIKWSARSERPRSPRTNGSGSPAQSWLCSCCPAVLPGEAGLAPHIAEREGCFIRIANDGSKGAGSAGSTVLQTYRGAVNSLQGDSCAVVPTARRVSVLVCPLHPRRRSNRLPHSGALRASVRPPPRAAPDQWLADAINRPAATRVAIRNIASPEKTWLRAHPPHGRLELDPYSIGTRAQEERMRTQRLRPAKLGLLKLRKSDRSSSTHRKLHSTRARSSLPCDVAPAPRQVRCAAQAPVAAPGGGRDPARAASPLSCSRTGPTRPWHVREPPAERSEPSNLEGDCFALTIMLRQTSTASTSTTGVRFRRGSIPFIVYSTDCAATQMISRCCWSDRETRRMRPTRPDLGCVAGTSPKPPQPSIRSKPRRRHANVSFRRPSWSDDGMIVFIGVADWREPAGTRKPGLRNRPGPVRALVHARPPLQHRCPSDDFRQYICTARRRRHGPRSSHRRADRPRPCSPPGTWIPAGRPACQSSRELVHPIRRRGFSTSPPGRSTHDDHRAPRCRLALVALATVMPLHSLGA